MNIWQQRDPLLTVHSVLAAVTAKGTKVFEQLEADELRICGWCKILYEREDMYTHESHYYCGHCWGTYGDVFLYSSQ